MSGAVSHSRLAHAATEPSSPNAKSTLRVDFERYATARASARRRAGQRTPTT